MSRERMECDGPGSSAVGLSSVSGEGQMGVGILVDSLLALALSRPMRAVSIFSFAAGGEEITVVMMMMR